MALPNKIVSMSPAEMRDTINALIELIEANGLDHLQLDFSGLNSPSDGEQLTYDDASGKWIPAAATPG